MTNWNFTYLDNGNVNFPDNKKYSRSKPTIIRIPPTTLMPIRLTLLFFIILFAKTNSSAPTTIIKTDINGYMSFLLSNSDWTKSLRDGLPRLWHSDFLFSITKQWKASPKSSIVKSPQNNNQTGSTSPLPMKRIPPFHLVGKRFYDPNAPPYKAVFLITTDFIWRILLCMKNI